MIRFSTPNVAHRNEVFPPQGAPVEAAPHWFAVLQQVDLCDAEALLAAGGWAVRDRLRRAATLR